MPLLTSRITVVRVRIALEARELRVFDFSAVALPLFILTASWPAMTL